MLCCFFCVLFSMIAARAPNINEHKKQLAALHILLEVGLLFNMVAIPVYWGALHHKVIGRFEGVQKVHMYLVHIFPTIGYYLNA